MVMRQAVNQNRTVQLALLGVLALAGGFLLLKNTHGSGEAGSPTSSSSASTATTGGTPSATGAATTAPTDTQDALAQSSSASVAGATAVPADIVPGPGLPKGLLSAYRNGDAIVLLVRRAGGIDDSLVRPSVELLRVQPRVKVYVTKAKSIARYAWLTQGVDVTELPALVVLRPRGLSHGTPTATVSYGFRGPNSVLQAVKDALYRGPTNRPYHP
jgi:hypothetical protein